MRMNVGRAQFQKALQSVARAIPGRTTIEILKNALMICRDGAAALVATDKEIGLRAEIEGAAIDAEGEYIIPAGRVLQICGESTAESLSIEAIADHVKIIAGFSEFRLQTESAKEFPTVPTFTARDYFRIPVPDFKQLIRRTVFACDPTSSRFALGGIQVEIKEGRAVFVGTDSRRLSAANCSIGETVGAPWFAGVSPVIPQKAIKLMETIDGGFVDIAFEANSVAIRSGPVSISAQLLTGRFPDWRKVMPTTFAAKIDFVAGPLLSAIRQAMIIREKDGTAIVFSFGGGSLTLKGEVADMGASKIQVPIPANIPNLSASFDPSFVADFLKSVDSGTQVEFAFGGAEDPAKLSVGTSFEYVVMPLSK